MFKIMWYINVFMWQTIMQGRSQYVASLIKIRCYVGPFYVWQTFNHISYALQENPAFLISVLKGIWS